MTEPTIEEQHDAAWLAHCEANRTNPDDNPYGRTPGDDGWNCP